MDINRIFGLHPVMMEIKKRLVNLMLFRGIGIGETVDIDASFVFEGEVYNMNITIVKVEEPEEAHFSFK